MPGPLGVGSWRLGVDSFREAPRKFKNLNELADLSVAVTALSWRRSFSIAPDTSGRDELNRVLARIVIPLLPPGLEDAPASRIL